MSGKTPRVSNNQLSDPVSGLCVAVDSPAWYEWLAAEEHRSFHFDDPTGGFTARKERKQRGKWYWVAYRQYQPRLHKLYLGKVETLSQAHLLAATQALAQHAAEEHHSAEG